MFTREGDPRALKDALQLIPEGWISNPLRLFRRVLTPDFGTLLPLTAYHTGLAHFTRYTVHGGATGVT